VACIAPIAVASGLPWEIFESPSRLAMLDPSDVVLERSSHCLDGCRYDRSNPGPENPADNPYPLRWLYRDGDEAIVFDERGPGAITRIWMTTGFGTSTCIDPAIRVRFYFDGASSPTLDLPLAALFDGSTPPFTPPLVADRDASSGGYVNDVPIAYAEALRIALVGADNGGTNPCTGNDERLLWFQLQHHRLAPGAPVTSFAPGDDFPAWRAFLAHAGDDPWNGMLALIDATSTLVPGQTLDLATRTGTAWLRGIRLHLPRSTYASVRLKVLIDTESAVDMPLADFFAASGDAIVTPRGVLAAEDAAGWLYAWIPMPFRESANIQLVADASLPAPVSVDSALAFEDAPVGAEAGSFAAELSDSCAATGNIVLYDGVGAGKVIGVSARYRASGAANLGYLEGDERAYFDGAIAPGWYGTGVEDFFDGGFYFDHGPFARPLAGTTLVDTNGAGTTAAYRWMLADPIVYANGLRLTQEVGFSPTQAAPMCVRSVVHAYRAARASVVAYDRFDVDTSAADAHAYTPPAGASCALVGGVFEDEPPTQRIASSCAYVTGGSRFTFSVADAVPPLRLRRTFDVSPGSPGEIAGAPSAEIRVDGIVAGHFPPAIANSLRRWQQQEALLDPSIGAGAHGFEIVPDFTATAPVLSESAFELSGGWKDSIFADGFEQPSLLALSRTAKETE
jgi:D-arabinan exo alpha-(1,3)/(1,5)-arabinofuranosidase (non-reducing end)